MFGGKPIIGIVGGIGSGKTYIAELFGRQGCLVISADRMVHEAYKDWQVREALRKWWGNLVLDSRGEVDRSAVARKIFHSAEERRRLEGLLHPIVNAKRERMMKAAQDDPAVQAFIWDTPLLIEAGLYKDCDVVVFVDSPVEVRQKRLSDHRGWDESELSKRESSQMPVHEKRQFAHYVIENATDEHAAAEQVRDVLKRVLAGEHLTRRRE